MDLRERVARSIARIVTGHDDVETEVVPAWPPMAFIKGGFTMVPRTGAPLWQCFLEAADEAIDIVEDEIERRRGYD